MGGTGLGQSTRFGVTSPAAFLMASRRRKSHSYGWAFIWHAQAHVDSIITRWGPSDNSASRCFESPATGNCEEVAASDLTQALGLAYEAYSPRNSC